MSAKSAQKQARRKARKAAQQKKKAGEFKPIFKGYMKIPLRSDITTEQTIADTVLTDDWAIQSGRILGRDRRYKVTIHLPSIHAGKKELVKNIDEDIKLVSTGNYQEKAI